MCLIRWKIYHRLYLFMMMPKRQCIISSVNKIYPGIKKRHQIEPGNTPGRRISSAVTNKWNNRIPRDNTGNAIILNEYHLWLEIRN